MFWNWSRTALAFAAALGSIVVAGRYVDRPVLRLEPPERSVAAFGGTASR